MSSNYLFISDNESLCGSADNIKVLLPSELRDTFNLNNEYKGIIILCELSKDTENKQQLRQNLYGIKLAQELRLKHVKAPILFISFLPESYIVNKAENTIVNTTGHSFFRLLSSPEQWVQKLETLNALSDIGLFDIQQNYCNIEGIAESKLHSLYSNTDNYSELQIKLENTLNEVFTLFNVNPAVAIQNYTGEFQTITDKNRTDALNYVLEKCRKLIKPDNDKKLGDIDNNFKIVAEEKWSLLLLDDEIHDEHQFVKELKKRKINVIIAGSVQNAQKILDDDTPIPEIMVVVTDYRLEEKGKHQDNQGYDFIISLADFARPLEMFVYSSMRRRFLLESQKYYKTQVHVYSKIDFKPENIHDIDYLCDTIVRAGNKTRFDIFNMPNNEGWNKNLKAGYIQIRNSSGRIAYEKEISYKANKWIREYNNKPEGQFSAEPGISGLIGGYSPKTNKNAQFFSTEKEFNSVIGMIKKTAEISMLSFTMSELEKINILKQYINRLRYSEDEITAVSSQYSEENIQHSKKYFIARRIAVWLSAPVNKLRDKDKFDVIDNDDQADEKKEKNKKEITSTYKNNHDICKAILNDEKLSEGTAKQIMFTLGLSLSDFPFSLTPEELSWLEFDQNIPVNEKLTDAAKKINRAKEIIKEHINKSDNLKELFSEKKIGKEDSTVYFNDEFVPYIRNFSDLKLIIKYVNEQTGTFDVSQKENGIYFEEFKSKSAPVVSLINNLKTLFKEDKFPEILAFLESISDPGTNKRRIKQYIHLYEPWLHQFSMKERIAHLLFTEKLKNYETSIEEYKTNCLNSFDYSDKNYKDITDSVWKELAKETGNFGLNKYPYKLIYDSFKEEKSKNNPTSEYRKNELIFTAIDGLKSQKNEKLWEIFTNKTKNANEQIISEESVKSIPKKPKQEKNGIDKYPCLNGLLKKFTYKDIYDREGVDNLIDTCENSNENDIIEINTNDEATEFLIINSEDENDKTEIPNLTKNCTQKLEFIVELKPENLSILIFKIT